MNKKILIYLIIFLLIFCFGFFSYQYQIFSNQIITKVEEIKNKYKNWENRIKIIKYYSGLSPWSDRNYFNRKNDEKLKDLYLIQIPRHYEDDIYLKITDEIIVFRVLCKKNDNTEYINWEKENYELKIIGMSCDHTDIVKKKFKKSVVKITPGGSDGVSNPIFIRDLKSSKKFSIIYNSSDHDLKSQ